MTSPWFSGRRRIVDRSTDAAAARPERTDIVVAGAGFLGLITAVEAARRGSSVVVIEAGAPGGVASGASGGIVSVLQGGRLSSIRRAHPQSLVDAYVDMSQDGRAWLGEFAARRGIAVRERPATVVAVGSGVEPERQAARAAGLEVRDVESAGFADGVSLDGQAVLNPRELVTALLAELHDLGVPVISGTAVTGVRTQGPVIVDTPGFSIEANAVVLATGTPILDRGLYFAKTAARRIRSVAFVGAPALDEILLPVDGPVRALHTTSADGREVLVATGAPERIVAGSASEEAIDAWVLDRYPSARPVARWWGIDHTSHDEIPFVGRLPRGRGRVWFGTAFDGWGLTLAPAAALRIVAEVRGEQPPPWVRVIARRITVPADFAEGIGEFLAVAAFDMRAWRSAPRTPIGRPREGDGVVARHGLAVVGISTVDGVTRSVSAVSPRLGYLVAWNRGERAWESSDGSRFGPDGSVRAGPARHGLTAWPAGPSPSPR